MQHRRSSTTDQRQSALAFPLQQSSMHRTPSSRDGGLKATSEAEELDARSTMSTTTAACDSTATAASMVLMKGRSLVDSKSSNSENNSNNGDESGYGSDSSPDSSGGDGGGADSTGCDDVDDDYDDGGDMRERIYFLREKQLLMERAGNVLSRRAERNYAAAMASDLCRGLTTESSSSASSSCGSSSSSGEEAAEKSGLKKRKRAATVTTTTTSNINIWIEAKRVLSEMNKKGSGYDDDCSGPILPIPTSIYRKRCAPTPIHPLIDHRIVQRVRSKLYDAESDVGTGQALLGSPFAPSNQWLTKALLWNSGGGGSNGSSSRDESATTARTWTVATDPFTYTFGLVPPPAVSLDDAFDLQDVINVSEEARVVTQSSPPFCVVHVNRAFLELADLPERDTLVGRPVESIFRVASFVDPEAAPSTPTPTSSAGLDQQAGPSTTSPRRHLTGTVQVGRRRNQSLYRLRVLPVVDRSRSRRRRLGDEAASSTTASFQCMSHVLIQVEPASLPQANTASSSATPSGLAQTQPTSRDGTRGGDRAAIPSLGTPSSAAVATTITPMGHASGMAGMIG